MVDDVPSAKRDPDRSHHDQTALEDGHDPQHAAVLRNNQLRRDKLDYIGQLARELADLAREARFDLIAYFLEMAVIEAGAVRRKIKP